MELITVRWPDGSVQKARSATEFLLRTAQKQWPNPDGSKPTIQGMKDELSKRAAAVSGKFIHPHQYDEPFLRELARVGLFELEIVEK